MLRALHFQTNGVEGRAAKVSDMGDATGSPTEGKMRPTTIGAGLIVLSVLVTGCATSIRHHDHAALSSFDFGPPRDVNVCVYLGKGVSENRARQLLSSWNEEASKFAL